MVQGKVRMKTIKVVAAIIVDNGRVFATQRGYGEFRGGWEFPGGKVEVGESLEAALMREIGEELELQIDVNELLETIEYDYPTFHLSMACFICSINSGKVILKEHESAQWVNSEQIDSLNWLPADQLLLEKIKSYLQ